MVYFIDDNILLSKKLNDLRDQIFNNTVLMVKLFRERKELAEEIGRLKQTMNLRIRDKVRENEVLENIPDLNPIEIRLMRMVFEMTISGEFLNIGVKAATSIEQNSGAVNIQSDFESLCMITGLLASSPGIEILSEKDLPVILSNALTWRGAHLVSQSEGETDYKICLGGQSQECAIELTNNGALNVKTEFFDKALTAEKVEVIHL